MSKLFLMLLIAAIAAMMCRQTFAQNIDDDDFDQVTFKFLKQFFSINVNSILKLQISMILILFWHLTWFKISCYKI